MLLGQELTVEVKNSYIEVKIFIETPSFSNRWVLQGSDNLKIWSDINDKLFYTTNHTISLQNSPSYFRLTKWSYPYPTSFAVIGDSTASTNGGWSSGLKYFLRKEASFIHLAYPWQSTKRFIESERFDRLIKYKPKHVFIQFGLMDEQMCGGHPDDCFTSDEEFENNISLIVSEIKKYSGIPILITPPSINWFDDTGTVGEWFPNRCQSIKNLAQKHNIVVVDLNKLTRELFNYLGERGSQKLNWPNDSIHFSYYGSIVIAELVINELPEHIRKFMYDPYF